MDRRFNKDDIAALESALREMFGEQAVKAQRQITDREAMDQGMKDMMLVRDKFLQFQKDIQDTVIADVLAPAIKSMADYMMAFHMVLDGTADKIGMPAAEASKGKQALLEILKDNMQMKGR